MFQINYTGHGNWDNNVYNSMRKKELHLKNIIYEVYQSHQNIKDYYKKRLRKICSIIIGQSASYYGYNKRNFRKHNFNEQWKSIKANRISKNKEECNATNWLTIIHTLRLQINQHFSINANKALNNNQAIAQNLYFIKYDSSPLKSISKKLKEKYQKNIKLNQRLLSHPTIIIDNITNKIGNNTNIMKCFYCAVYKVARLLFKNISLIYRMNLKYFIYKNFILKNPYLWLISNNHFCTPSRILKIANNLTRQLSKIHKYPNKKSLFHSKFAPIIENVQARINQISQEKAHQIKALQKKKKINKIKSIRQYAIHNKRLRLGFLLHCDKNRIYTFTGTYGAKSRKLSHSAIGKTKATLIDNVCYKSIKETSHVWVCSNILPSQVSNLPKGTKITFDAKIYKYKRRGGLKVNISDYGLAGHLNWKQNIKQNREKRIIFNNAKRINHIFLAF